MSKRNKKRLTRRQQDIPMLHYLVWIQEKRILEKETGQIRL